MSKGRLTRQELGWLLTQEAQGAAERLRVGVQVLKTNAPPPIEDAEPPSAIGGVDASLAALDDVMRMLSSLHPKPASAVRGRRGRVDAATLMWEVAPDARVSMEPGSGTEVIADEGELRRMLHVLVGQGSGLGSAVTIKREGDDVRISVALGPDSSATAETERAWLSRMAVRYGGRLELEGGTESLVLPAEDAAARDERDALRRELDEARRQGEAYARELAAVFAQGEEAGALASSFPPSMAPSVERFAALSRFAGGITAELRGLLAPIGRELTSLRGARSSRPPPAMAPVVLEAEGVPAAPPSSPPPSPEAEDRVEAMRRRLLGVQEFLTTLAALGDVDVAEAAADVDVAEVARSAAGALGGRAERGEVTVDVTGEQATAHVVPGAAALLVREILAQAIAATPRGGNVSVSVTPRQSEDEGLGTRVVVDDGGPALPASARRAFLAMELDPGTYGRPTSVPLYVAAEVAAWQGALLELADAPSGGLRVVVTFARSGQRSLPRFDAR